MQATALISRTDADLRPEQAATWASERLTRRSDLRSALWLTDAHLAVAEKAVANLSRLRTLALSVTGDLDWVDLSGHPYLTTSGSLKIAALFSVSFTDTRVEETREKLGEKEVVRFSVMLRARFMGRELDVVGGASSDESFFAKRDGKPVPLSEVNLNSVRKKAVTNAQSRAVKALLGLGGLTWEDLKAAGVQVKAMPKVDFGKTREARAAKPATGAAGATATAPATTPPAPTVQAAATPPATSKAKERLANMLLELATFEEEPFDSMLRRYTEFKGVDGQPHWAKSVEHMSDAWVSRIYERVEKDWASPKGERSID